MVVGCLEVGFDVLLASIVRLGIVIIYRSLSNCWIRSSEIFGASG